MEQKPRYNNITVTPLLGGCEEYGVCSLLELGDYRILLDCGCTADYNHQVIRTLEVFKLFISKVLLSYY